MTNDTANGVTDEAKPRKRRSVSVPVAEKAAWSAAETAAMVGVASRHLYRMVDEGKFPPPRRLSAGRTIWIPSEVREHIQKLPTG